MALVITGLAPYSSLNNPAVNYFRTLKDRDDAGALLGFAKLSHDLTARRAADEAATRLAVRLAIAGERRDERVAFLVNNNTDSSFAQVRTSSRRRVTSGFAELLIPLVDAANPWLGARSLDLLESALIGEMPAALAVMRVHEQAGHFTAEVYEVSVEIP